MRQLSLPIVVFDRCEIDAGIFVSIADAFPIDAGVIFQPICVAFGFILAFDAHDAVRHGVEPTDENSFVAHIADAVTSLLNTLECEFDLYEFPAFEFREAGRKFIPDTAERHVGEIATGTVAHIPHIDTEAFAEFGAALREQFGYAAECVFADHHTTPSV